MNRQLAVTATLALSTILASCSGHNASIPQTGTASKGAVRTASSATSAGGWGSDSAVWSLVGAVKAHSTFGTGDEIAANMAPAPQGWANTATQAFKLWTGPSTDLGVLAASTPMNINVVLQMRNAAQLKQLVAGGQQIGDASFLATYAPTQAQTQQVVSYLTSMGFTNVTPDTNRLLVSAQGTAAQVNKAFNTTMHAFSASGTALYGNASPALVPSSLNGVAIAVLGLNNVQAKNFIKLQASTAQQTAPAAAPTPEPCTITAVPFVPVLLNVPEPPNPVTPPVQPPPPLPQIPTVPGVPVPASGTVCERNFYATEFQNTYDTLSMKRNTLFHDAVLGAGDPTLGINDFHTNQTDLGVPLTSVVVRNGTSLPTTGNQGDDEWTLDMLSSTSVGGGTPSLYFYAAPDASDNSLEATINKWAIEHRAPVLNASLGLCEIQPWLDGSMHAVDQTLLYAAAFGETLFASTGDSGSQCFIEAVGENGYPGDFPDVEWPATASYSVGVGGTSLFSNQNDLSYSGENAWNEGGGGISYFEYEPPWGGTQQYVGGILLDNPGRGIPDIAFDADLDTGVFIYLTTIGGPTGGPGWFVSGGTSLASPLGMGVFDRIMNARGHRIYVPPVLYQIYTNKIGTGAPPSPTALCLGPPPTSCFSQGPPPTENIAGFHDVLTGENNLYDALPGYDYTTGLGSVDGAQLVNSVKMTGH